MSVIGHGIILNAPSKPRQMVITLPTASWAAGNGCYWQQITIPGSTLKTKVDISIVISVYNALVVSKTKALIAQNSNGTITVYAIGGKPTTNLDVHVTATEVQ